MSTVVTFFFHIPIGKGKSGWRPAYTAITSMHRRYLSIDQSALISLRSLAFTLEGGRIAGHHRSDKTHSIINTRSKSSTHRLRISTSVGLIIQVILIQLFLKRCETNFDDVLHFFTQIFRQRRIIFSLRCETGNQSYVQN